MSKTQLLLMLISGLLVWGCQSPTQNPTPSDDPDTFINVNSDGVIIDGYDPVAFFTEGKPVKGSSDFQVTYKGAIYQFASEDHKQLFESNTEKYKVQFGGWCAYAVSLGRIAPIKINTWSIVNDRLVIQHNQRAVRGWEKDPQNNLLLADKYWPYVAGNDGKQILTDEEKAFLVNVDRKGLLLEGYDPVAYFTENKAVQGNEKFNARYNGATYWFANAENQTSFKDNPAKYAPQYGAFCAYAMSKNRLRPINPTLFQIIDGRLMLQHSQKAFDLFNKDLNGNVDLADKNWPGQVAKRAGQSVNYDAAAK